MEAKAMAEAMGRGASRWRIAGWGLAVFILLIPLAAIQFTDEVNWTAGDFVFAVVMFGSVGLTLELTFRKSGRPAYRGAVGFALAAAFLLIWINGAVGIIGDEGNPANLMYGGVLAVALVGAITARFAAAGMARAMFLTALAQAAVTAIALFAGLGALEPPGPTGIVVINGFFLALWALSGGLFRRAARSI
jgi:hypothetical protein